MRIWSLEECNVDVFPLEGCGGINVFPLNDCEVSVCDPYQCDVTVFSPTCIDLNIYIPGPSGPTGPQGPVGPQGPSGSSQGIYKIPSTTQAIPVGQIYTIGNGVGAINLTLPLISSVIMGNLTQPYTVKNISSSNLNLICAGSDQILSRGQFSTTANIFPDDSLDFLPTSEGWLII